MVLDGKRYHQKLANLILGWGQGVIFEFQDWLVPWKGILEAFGTGIPARNVTVKFQGKFFVPTVPLVYVIW